MRLLPLSLTATPTAWTAAVDAEGPRDLVEAVAQRDGLACRFCGDPNPVGPALFHIDGDHSRWTVENTARACLLCHATQHLGRDTIDQEAMLIWAPQITQAALNRLVLAIHRTFHSHGAPPCLDARPPTDTPRLRAAYRSYAALARMGEAVEAAIGTTSPHQFGATLLEAARKRRPVAFGGIRLLHRGRHIAGGRDAYPALLGPLAP